MTTTDFDPEAWAREAFDDGYHADDGPLPRHQDRTPNDLAATCLRVGIEKGQVEATWKLLRDIALLSDPEDANPLSVEQAESIASLLASDAVPPTLAAILRAATAAVKTQRDLHVLTYVFLSAWERM